MASGVRIMRRTRPHRRDFQISVPLLTPGDVHGIAVVQSAPPLGTMVVAADARAILKLNRIVGVGDLVGAKGAVEGESRLALALDVLRVVFLV